MEVAVKASILNDVCHLPPGFSGLMAALILLIAWVVSYSGKKYVSYDLDPKGVIGTFEPILARYLRIAEFIIGVATPGQSCSSGFVIIAREVVLALGLRFPVAALGMQRNLRCQFMACLIMNDENVRHGNPHTPARYALSETFGFGSLGCFCAGYIFLVVLVTR